jgi:hypothetical protein
MAIIWSFLRHWVQHALDKAIEPGRDVIAELPNADSLTNFQQVAEGKQFLGDQAE